jgi:hypothetical protein
MVVFLALFCFYQIICSRWIPRFQGQKKVNFNAAVRENASFNLAVAHSQDGNILKAWT